VFFVASILFLNFNWKVLLGVFICILIGYWYVMTQIPINGEAPLLDKVSNLATVIDTKVLTRAHMWKIYDPEGLLSTIPAIATSIFGMLFGKMLISQNRSNQEKLMFFIVIGIVALAAGYLFSIIFPLNKALWTSSFVLVTGGWACLIYALIYYITDVLKKTKWGTPAIIFGSNAITVFFLSGVIGRLFGMIKVNDDESIHGFLYGHLSSIITNPKLSSLIYAIGVIVFYYLVALVLYKKKIFIKV
jgi:predicted acyltransferase